MCVEQEEEGELTRVEHLANGKHDVKHSGNKSGGNDNETNGKRKTMPATVLAGCKKSFLTNCTRVKIKTHKFFMPRSLEGD